VQSLSEKMVGGGETRKAGKDRPAIRLVRLKCQKIKRGEDEEKIFFFLKGRTIGGKKRGR